MKKKTKTTLLERLKNFMDAWENKDPSILDYCQKTWQEKNCVEFFQDFYFDKDLLKYRIVKYRKIGDACKDVQVNIVFKQNGKVNKRKLNVRCICESEAFKPTSNGKWGVNPISGIRGL